MNRFRKARIGLLLILLSFLVPGLSASADLPVNAEKKILVLLPFHEQLPWSESFRLGLKKAQLKYGREVQFYVENMESIRLNKSLTDLQWLAYLSNKYQMVQFDAAIAESYKASLFLRQYGRQFLGDIPHVYHYPATTAIEDTANSKSLTTNFRDSIEKTLQIAIRQNRNAKQLVIIDGQNNMSRAMINDLLPLTKNYPQLKVTILKDYSLAELKKTLSLLPANSIVFYSLIFRDKTGKQFVPKEALADIAATANAPIYSQGSSLLGSGTVGGHMLDGELTALQMVTAAMDYLEKGAFQAAYPMTKSAFDWQALSRYRIDPNTIPDDAAFINKPGPLIENYFKELLLLSIAMMLFIFLITLYWVRKLARLNQQLKIANKKVMVAKKRAEQLARTDYLSGMNNRRAFFDKSQQVLVEAKRNNTPFSLLVLDIDHFKAVNDHYGHAIGDEIIKSIATTIKLVKREMDISARFGGEEFVILSPATDISGAVIFANRMRMEIERTVYKSAGYSINITVSIGVFSIQAHSESYSLADYIKRADDALYRAKQGGRNRVEVCDGGLIENCQQGYGQAS